jgi:hypothetical protein
MTNSNNFGLFDVPSLLVDGCFGDGIVCEEIDLCVGESVYLFFAFFFQCYVSCELSPVG